MSTEAENPSPETPATVDSDAPPHPASPSARYVRCAEIDCPSTMGPDSPELPRFCPDHNDRNP